jgi:ubiquinone/menaquinone biosynthesis C-methylase UbiE
MRSRSQEPGTKGHVKASMARAESPEPKADHYSYLAYADPAMAERFDRVRFGGPIGALLLEDQERVLGDFLGDLTGRQVIDVGTGTGRAAIALARLGAQVIGVDASAPMLDAARKRAAQAGLSITFERDDAHALPFATGTFDHAVSLRVLMHTPDWRRCLGELCRVTRHSVVVDFPALASAAALQAIARRATQAMGPKVEAYRVFTLRTITRELERQGFRVRRVHRQFVLPIAAHKLIGSRSFTVTAERALAAVGLLRLAGSPVTIVAERQGPQLGDPNAAAALGTPQRDSRDPQRGTRAGVASRDGAPRCGSS